MSTSQKLFEIIWNENTWKRHHVYIASNLEFTKQRFLKFVSPGKLNAIRTRMTPKLGEFRSLATYKHKSQSPSHLRTIYILEHYTTLLHIKIASNMVYTILKPTLSLVNFSGILRLRALASCLCEYSLK